MNKFFKLTGVSMLAIMTATNANAAGYTCEELIEYTSCNPGYYLSTVDTTCPDGYTYVEDACFTFDHVDIAGNTIFEHLGNVVLIKPDLELCEVDDYSECGSMQGFCELANTWLGTGCFMFSEDGYFDDEYGNEYDFIEKTAGHTTVSMCVDCPIGHSCAGGTAGATLCPAGSYCATTGLKEPTGKCAVGSYAASGATSCMSCPSTGLTDINGAVVNATTLSTGSTSVSACIVGSESQFKDTKGTYHFKSDCSYSVSIATPDGCEILGGSWDDFSADCSGVDGSVNPGKDFVYEDGVCKSQLEYAGSEYIEENGGSVSWNGEYCECSGTWWYTDQEVILYCQE